MYRLSQRAIFFVAALGAAQFACAAQKTTPADDSKPGTINVTLLGPMFRVQGLQMEDRARVLDLVGRAKPVAIDLSVCPATTQDTLAAFRADLERVYAGPVEIHVLPVKAVECTWHSPKGPARST